MDFKKQKKKSKRPAMILVAVFLLTLIFSKGFAQESLPAAESLPKEKSMALAVGLGLSPIPGDGLIYAGGTAAMTAGIIDLLAGSAGWALLAVAKAKCRDLDDCNFPGLGVALGGGALVGITYLVDAISAPLVVHSHNSKIEQRRKISPLFQLDGERKVFGVAFSF